jgi:hypothetical protein
LIYSGFWFSPTESEAQEISQMQKNDEILVSFAKKGYFCTRKSQ